MTDQLELGGLPKPKRPSLAAQMCVCGCFDERHVDGAGGCTVHMACTKFRPRVKKPVAQPEHLMPPPGALLLERDDTKRDKRMGWALANARAIDREIVPSHGGRALLMYLAQLKTKSLNDNKALGFMSDTQRKRFFASRTAYIKSLRERACSAIAQASTHFGVEVSEDHPPTRVILTRVCSGKLDDDNLIGAFKPLRDGVADALGVDDKRFSIFTDGDVRITYRQEAPGKRKVCGVRIELTWEGT